MKSPLEFLARAAAFAALLAGAFPALSQGPSTTPSIGRNYLWQVSSMTNKVYLYGTVHAGKRDWYPLPEPVETAFAESGTLAVEADITNDEAMAKSMSGLGYKPPDSLEKHVRPEDYVRFKRLLAKYAIPEAQTTAMKPFIGVSMLVFAEWGRLGYLPQYGIDGYLIGKAKAAKKKLVEIEGVEMQVALMESIGEEEGRTLFASTLNALESGLSGEQVTGIMNAWQSGDPGLVLEIARKYNAEVKGAKEFEEKFIWSRHDDMLRKIEGYLGSKERTFVAVGALHLAGDRGLVELLRKRGYLVKQL